MNSDETSGREVSCDGVSWAADTGVLHLLPLGALGDRRVRPVHVGPRAVELITRLLCVIVAGVGGRGLAGETCSHPCGRVIMLIPRARGGVSGQLSPPLRSRRWY